MILAGGKGTRLAPFTTVLPKPLMPLGDRSILDVVVRQLRMHGFTELTFAVGYLSHLIQAVFGDGAAHGVRIDYHVEEEPLGTAGPLRLIDPGDGDFLAMNGDILTTLDYRRFLDCHRRSENVFTVASHRRVLRSEYGVLEVQAGAGALQPVTGYREKPEVPYMVSMGIYALGREALEHVPPSGRFDIPDLVLALLAAGKPVGSYSFDGYWLDIGRHDDYAQALEDADTILPQLLSAAVPPVEEGAQGREAGAPRDGTGTCGGPAA